MNKQETQLFNRALAAGIVQAGDAPESATHAASWIVVAMGFVGALLAMLPFLVIFLLAFERTLEKGSYGGLIFGVMGLGVALFIWRFVWEKTKPRPSAYGFLVLWGLMFVMAAVALLMLSKVDVLLIAAMVFCLGMVVNIHWIQQLLGFAVGMALANLVLLSPELFYHKHSDEAILVQQYLPYVAWFMAAAWALWTSYESKVSARFGASVWIEKVSRTVDAMAAAVLVSVAVHSSILLQSVLGGGGNAQGSADSAGWGSASLWHWSAFSLLQALIILALGAYLAKRWGLFERSDAAMPETMTQRRFTLALLAIAYASWALLTYTSQGDAVVCTLATFALATLRKRLFGLALLVLLAQLSGFYYALAWTLVQKAILLVGVGLGVAAAVGAAYAAWGRNPAVGVESNQAPPDTLTPTGLNTRRLMWVIGLGGVVALGAVNYDVYKKEQIIAHGQKIYIPLRPADPRSLMQGDYMALSFQLSREERRGDGTDTESLMGDRFVFATLDKRGVATLDSSLSLAAPAISETSDKGNSAAAAPAAPRIRLPLKYKNGGWTLVTDAFYFPEGQGEPFEKAVFGEFRSLPDGRALLVGLADADLHSIKPSLKTNIAK